MCFYCSLFIEANLVLLEKSIILFIINQYKNFIFESWEREFY